jgi:hypothetical protein
LAPPFKAASFTASSNSVFSLIGISNEFFSKGVFQLISPYPFWGASLTGSVSSLEFTFAICTADAAAFAIVSSVRLSIAAKPQLPFAITRIHIP